MTTVGRLSDELKKWISKGGRPVEHFNKPKPTSLAASETGGSSAITDWKQGVTPMKQGASLAERGLPNRAPPRPARPTMEAAGPVSLSDSVGLARQRYQNAGLALRSAIGRPLSPSKGVPEAPKVAESPLLPLRFGSVKQPFLSRLEEFKRPDDWVAAGAELHAPLAGGGRVLAVRIGVDFGTAYTKVAIRAADKVFFVPWSGIRNSDVRYLLPGELSRFEDDALWLGRCSTEVRSDLKLPFLSGNSSDSAQQAAAMAFLASVIRYARAWLYHAQLPILKGRTLAWELNLGCPTNSWSSGPIRNVYERIAARAWQLSQVREGINWERAVALLSALDVSLEDIGLDGLNLMPEFIAQIAGYVRSPQRKNGLHMLMDVGAGTVDLATFNVFYDEVKEEDRYPIFGSEVLPLGTHFLMATRLRSCASEEGDWDDLQAIPGDEELAKQIGAKVNQLKTADVAFEARLRGEIKRVLSYTRARRYGKAPEWNHGLPVFLTGGGSDCAIYSRALATACAACRVPYRRTSLPLFDEAAAGGSFSANEFHRLSVAYGLTFDAQSIGRILAPHEVDDAPAYDPIVDAPRDWPDRDDLYPK